MLILPIVGNTALLNFREGQTVYVEGEKRESSSAYCQIEAIRTVAELPDMNGLPASSIRAFLRTWNTAAILILRMPRIDGTSAQFVALALSDGSFRDLTGQSLTIRSTDEGISAA